MQSQNTAAAPVTVASFASNLPEPIAPTIVTLDTGETVEAWTADQLKAITAAVEERYPAHRRGIAGSPSLSWRPTGASTGSSSAGTSALREGDTLASTWASASARTAAGGRALTVWRSCPPPFSPSTKI